MKLKLNEFLEYNGDFRSREINQKIFDWFLRLMAYQLFVGYLMPKQFS